MEPRTQKQTTLISISQRPCNYRGKMASRLPTVPRIVFTVLEPISLLSGALPAIFTPQWFTSQQIPNTSPSQLEPSLLSPNSTLITQQLGSMYLLAFFLSLSVLHATAEIRVVKAYLWALWLADLTHICFTCAALGGWEESLAVTKWNAMTWGNIGATLALNLTRGAYFLGLFGEDLPPAQNVTKKDGGNGKKEL
ncbi:hypothetical protein QBC44DRAFT_318070 [Cladorrhinum sp. PSN332]|nr:hypothetical protein QBC44DRAFT_318070 [Cladorrhinum sp. PSN332]